MNLLCGKQWVAIAPLLAIFACTPLIDHSAAQCNADSDCDRFGIHPFCVDHICVPSKFQPEACFYPSPTNTPTKREDFLNACSASFLPSEIPGRCESPPMAPPPEGGLPAPPTTPPPAPGASRPPVPTIYCADMAPPGGSVLYMSGSSNFKPLLEKLAPFVVTTKQMTPVFKVTTSCTGVRSMDPTLPAYQTEHSIRDPAPNSTDTYAQYYGNGKPIDCLLGPGGAVVDVGESEIFPETCGVTPNMNDVAYDLGPILPIVLVVPQMSHERAISAESARVVFGGGGWGPWSDPKNLFIRGAGTATLRLVGLAIGVEPNGFWGVDQGSAEAMANNLQVANPPDKSIGMIGTDLYDTFRYTLRTLGFQASGQKCAYLPDSRLTSRDKINVRDGHYPLWGRLHFFSAVEGGRRISDAATAFISLFTLPVVPQEMLDAFIDSSFIPDCAMKIRQEGELGLPVSEAPAISCSCYFDARINGEPPAGCTACETNSDCLDPIKPVCTYHFCEAFR